ncbi:hypothetical protein INS49_012177 [Diaporthe citri]|uniref:uncharacterized protein n=1 Tax=Diaporthe citri TaxID=83186 RepID=UPI001C8211DE|nr:uncharacterized protein INS49_012177 [Diaporthe citri]KAG6358659.1 hypothetical protein INS49_012177 [Diaporthe citri]
MADSEAQSRAAPAGDPSSGPSEKSTPNADLSTETAGPADVPWKASKRTQLVFASLCVLGLMSALDGTSIGVAVPTIANALHGTAIESWWAGTAFLLSSTVFQPNWVSFSNIFGRRNLFLLSTAFFLAGAIVCGVAQNFTTLLVGRTIQGTGAGGIMSIQEVLITDLIPLRYRGDYYGLINAMWTLGSVTGPILGGGFSGNPHATWRWVFYINFPFIGIGTILVVLYMHLHFVPSSLVEKLRAIDWVGSFLFIASCTAFLLGLTWGGVQFSWGSYQTLVPLILGAAGSVAFVVYEGYVAANPIIPLVLFQNRTTVVSFVGTVPAGLILWCILYYMPLYFQAVHNYSPVISGVALFPLTFTIAPAAIACGSLITKTGKYRWATWAGWGLSTLGLGLFCILDVGTSIPGWVFITLVPGLGLGFLLPGLATAIQASVSSDNVAMAIAMFSFFRALGQALGVAIGGVIFQNRIYANLLTYPNLAPRAAQYSADSSGLVTIIQSMPDGDDKSDLKQAYADSLRIVWAVCCAVAGVGLLLSLFVQHYSLDQVLNTKQGVIEGGKDDSSGGGNTTSPA